MSVVGVAEFADVIEDAALDMLLREEPGPFTVFAPERNSLSDITSRERDDVVRAAPLHVTRGRNFLRDLRNGVTMATFQQGANGAELVQFNRYSNGVRRTEDV